jgi:hypothetical protein
MGPQGPVPIQGPIEVKTLAEAVAAFPQAMEDAMMKMAWEFEPELDAVLRQIAEEKRPGDS